MIYLDNSAGCRPYKEVIDTVSDVLTNHWGNASSNTSFGDDAMQIINRVTQRVTDDINCDPSEVIWTSGGCESNSLALLGFLKKNPGYTLYTTNLEHASINAFVTQLQNSHSRMVGHVTIPVGEIGVVNPESLRHLLIERQKYSNHKPFVSIAMASSEVGAIQNIKEIAKIVHRYNGILHCDAVQLYPWQKIDVQDLDIDFMSVSGQKLHCVKGIGFLYKKDSIEISPLILGSQQAGARAGTYPTHLIAAFGTALELTRKNNATNKVAELRNRMLDKLLTINGTHLNGPSIYNNRLFNNISLTIDGVRGSELMTMADLMGVIIGVGSACQSHIPQPSKALLAIGLTPEQALSTIRITLDEFNTEEEIDEAADIIIQLVERVRSNV